MSVIDLTLDSSDDESMVTKKSRLTPLSDIVFVSLKQYVLECWG